MDLKNVFVFFAMVAVTISCRKEPEQGPRGPQGPPGPAGGVESDLYTVNESDWVFEAPSYYGDIEVPELTEKISKSGAVLVYLQLDEEAFSQLPLTFYESDEYSSTLEVISYPGGVSIVWTDSDLAEGGTPPDMTFKIALLEGSGKTATSSTDHDAEPNRIDVTDHDFLIRR